MDIEMLRLTKTDIAVIEQLIIAAGKSPHTGADGMATACHYLNVLREARKESNVVPIKKEDAAHG